MSFIVAIAGWGAILFGAYGIARTVQVWSRARHPELGPLLLVQFSSLIVVGVVVVVMQP